MTTYSELNNFFSDHKKLRYKKGEVILRADDQPKGVCFLHKGFVKQYAISPTGEELVLIIFKPGDFFPIIWAINESSYSYYLEAITPVELYCAPREQFLEFLEQNPATLFELTSRVLIRMGGLLARMEHLVFGNAYHKVASILYICAERFGEKDKGQAVIPFHLTHKLIADFIGLSRETTSVEMKNLEREGLIKYKGRTLKVNDLAKLKKESLLHDA